MFDMRAGNIFLLCLCCAVVTSKTTRSSPNIIIIVADDLGWNDVGFHGSNQIPTPNIDALAYSGLILNNYYVMPVCTPSRAALLTGKHPIHTGMQHHVLFANEPWGLGLTERLLPEYLLELGYRTHAVGKWHLGHFRKDYTPTNRGFDTHFGYWAGHQDYYDHTAQDSQRFWGYDMRRGMNVSRDSFGHYSTSLFTDEAVKLIKNHDTSIGPMFLYLAHLAVHSANPYLPLQAPEDEVKKFEHIADPHRRTFAAMLSILDRGVGEVVSALGERGMLENSVIVFTTDNGGPAGGFNSNAASNWPLRGVKDTIWEGGVRGAALVWSPLLGNEHRVSTQLSHIQDWLPTLLASTNSNLTLPTNLDGQNLWEAFKNPKAQTYSELLIALDPRRYIAAVRKGKWKLVQGTTWAGHYDRVIGPTGRGGHYDLEAVQNSLAARALAKTKRSLPSASTILSLRREATVNCAKEDPSKTCHASKGETCLFDLTSDPCESNNLAPTEPNVVDTLRRTLAKYLATMVTPRNKIADPASNPKYWDYTWNNWKDYPLPPALHNRTSLRRHRHRFARRH